ncbi:unnamed protein product, partial [Durusdinium trenchii]
MSRLAQLLRQFQLPLGASSSDLRKAYFRQAKQLHPDCNPSQTAAAEEFACLRADFEEALKLMEQKAKFGGEPPPFSGENGFENQKWSAAAWSARSQERERRFSFREHMRRNFVYEARGGVPVEGLPQETVYTVVGAFSAGFFLLGIWKFLTSERIGVRHRLGPEWLRPDGDLRTFAPESAPPQPRTLRRALEGMKEKSTSSFPGSLQSPLMAHHAAANDRVWWLERCGATPGCRPMLNSKDERGDTPLHHCARTGQKEACCALLRYNVEQSVNHFGLAPQQLAQQLGHKDVAVILRSHHDPSRLDVASCAARRRIARHPDGLGHRAMPEDGIDFDFDSADCLRQAAKMAGLNLEVPEMTTEQASRWAAQHLEPRHTLEMEVGAGLLVYERPGQVTPDAKGHWHTLRRGKAAVAGIKSEKKLLQGKTKRGLSETGDVLNRAIESDSSRSNTNSSIFK